jgi:hypothetical protein
MTQGGSSVTLAVNRWTTDRRKLRRWSVVPAISASIYSPRTEVHCLASSEPIHRFPLGPVQRLPATFDVSGAGVALKYPARCRKGGAVNDQAPTKVGVPGRTGRAGARWCYVRIGGCLCSRQPEPDARGGKRKAEPSETAPEKAEPNEPALPGGGYADADNVQADTQQEGIH